MEEKRHQNLVTKSSRYTKSSNFKEKQITCFFMKKKCCHVRMLSPNKSCSKDNLDGVIDMQQYNPLIHQQLRESKIQAAIHTYATTAGPRGKSTELFESSCMLCNTT